jgi:hypothetical protein
MSRQQDAIEHRVGSTSLGCPLQQATLTVQVVRADNREPVAGATVSLISPVQASRETSRAGMAQFAALAEATYTIRVSAPEARAAMFRGTVSVEVPVARGASVSTVVELSALVFLRLKLVRGTAPRTGRCKVLLLSAEDGKPESVLATLDSVEIAGGNLHVIATAPVAAAVKFAWVYFLDDTGTATGEGLSLIIEAPPAEPDAKASSQALRALGFLEKLPLTTTRPTPSQILEIEMALARFQRVFGVPVRRVGVEAYGGLQTRYLDYAHRPDSLPRLEFTDRVGAITPLQIRLALFRGTARRSGKFRAIVDADDLCTEIYRTAAQSFSNGEISFPLEHWVANSARAVRIYLLNAEDEETGEGFYLRVAATRDIAAASTRGQILRALGFLEKEPPAGSTVTESQQLELDLALARFQRSRGATITEDGADLRAALQAGYLEYRP